MISKPDPDRPLNEISAEMFEDDDTTSSAPEPKDEVIAEDETRAVFWLRLMVMCALLLAAVSVAGAVFWLIDRALERTLLAEFSGSAEKLFESFEAIVLQKLGALVSLGSSVTAYARGNNRTFPFVTMNDFQERAATARMLSSALSIEVIPQILPGDREQWEQYSTENAAWYEEGFVYQNGLGFDTANGRFRNATDARRILSEVMTGPEAIAGFSGGSNTRSLQDTSAEAIDYSSGIANRIFVLNLTNYERIPAPNPGPWFPAWQSSPVRASNYVNYDKSQIITQLTPIRRAVANGTIQVTEFASGPPGTLESEDLNTRFYASLLSLRAGKNMRYDGRPLSLLFAPIFDTFKKDRRPVGVMYSIVDWASYFEGILSPNSKAVVLVISNVCYGEYSYSIDGITTKVLGEGDHHSPKYDQYKRTADFAAEITVPDGTPHGIPLEQGECQYKIAVYPSDEMYNEFHTFLPWVVAFAILLVFAFSICTFLLYDRLVERRQQLVLSQAEQTTAIVSSLFPESIRKRLLRCSSKKDDKISSNFFMSPNHRLMTFLSEGETEDAVDDQPIADLLQFIKPLTLSQSASEFSRSKPSVRRGLFRYTVVRLTPKIQGDCYVAVTGLPNPQPRHAVIMARFAWEAKQRMGRLTRKLEMTLGPDTTELGIRIGLHSGPVTAGVLRGDKSRFQLFGDTVNTAARMESTGVMNRIQVSQTTASLLIEAGKATWIRPRDDKVVAKGKGVLSTFWLVPGDLRASVDASEFEISSHDEGVYDEFHIPPEKLNRLIQWIVDLLSTHIRKVVAVQRGNKYGAVSRQQIDDSSVCQVIDGVPLDEVVDIIHLPKFNAKAATSEVEYRSVDLDPIVVAELREFVLTIASRYWQNPFHNFEHACHVTMCVEKFLQRIVAPDLDLDQLRSTGNGNANDLASQLHDYTHGITTDPMTPLAILFSSLIHDVDHRGCSNSQLDKEEKNMASMYKGKSTAEQNSLDISWGLFMSPQCKNLRAALFTSQAELMRFRQLLVNVVLATDIFDKELNGARKTRWEKAFSADGSSNADLRATIVIEHIIQASDVSHTMQHWHVYRKWNRRLFLEMCRAFKDGRMAADPKTFWYEGELGFFDNYVIPLAKKLKDCNVFGVSSDECLNYAIQNRAEWEARGEEILAELIDELDAEPTDCSLEPGQVRC